MSLAVLLGALTFGCTASATWAERCTRGSFPNKQAWQVFDEHGHCKDVETEKRLKEVGQQVTRFACLHTAEKAGKFLREYESAAENLGGEPSE